MAFANCHGGDGLICLDEKNASAACNRNFLKCEWLKYPDITYIFRSVETSDGFGVNMPSNAIGVSTNKNNVSWLEPTNKAKDKK